VSAKAAKNDAALVSTHLWDQRILLLLPCIHGGLPYLRSWLMRFQRSRLYAEFRGFMVATHGADWSAGLFALRVERWSAIYHLRRSGGPAGQQRGEGLRNSNANSNAPPSKRAKLQGKQPRDKRLPVQPPTKDFSLLRTPSAADTELLRDATAGTAAISKICNSSWWDWPRGSTLAFWRWPAGEQRRCSRPRRHEGLRAVTATCLQTCSQNT
jgi:hypothetical protein